MRKSIIICALIPLIMSGRACAEDMSVLNSDINAQKLAVNQEATKTAVEPAKEPVIEKVLVEDPKAKRTTPKIDLKAVVFDKDADFKASAKEEGREMTRLEEWQDDVHEALHGEVSKISGDPLLKPYMTKKFEHGPFSELSLWSGMRGSMQNVWEGENYQNTLYQNNMLLTVLDGKFKNPKFAFRSMYLWTPGKEKHDFFNDVWGDQYITYDPTATERILFGYSRYESGYEGNMGPITIPFFTRTQIGKTYGDARNLGVKVSGRHKYYNYCVGIGSGGRNFYDWFPGPEFNAGFAVKPLAKYKGKYGDMLVGATLDAGNGEGVNLQKGTFKVANAFLDYEYKRWKGTFEYGVADGSNGSTGYTVNKSEGVAGTLTYRLTPRIQLLGRYDWFDPNKDKANDIRTEYTAGLNYFIKGQALRLMVNYTMYSVENGTYGSRIYAGTQILL